MQQNLFTVAGQRLPLEGGDVTYYPDWLAARQANAAKQTLTDTLQWRQDEIVLYGRAVKIPRLQAWYGDAHCRYRYSGLSLAPLPWTDTLATLRQQCEATAGAPFNCVLANWYQHGQHSMGMHADDEPELGNKPVIASLSLGEARPFIFQHRKTKASTRLELEHGSLLVMAGETQQHYLHGINKTRKAVGDRINLTFRYIAPMGSN